jgi:hypothetical protein
MTNVIATTAAGPQPDAQRCAQRQRAAARMRLARHRRAIGAVHVHFDVFPEGIAALVDLGWLAADEAGSPESVKTHSGLLPPRR